MLCSQKFEQGHKCLKSQLYHLLIKESVNQERELKEFLDCVDNLEEREQKEDSDGYTLTISLHAFQGTKDCQIIRVVRKIKKQPMVMLIDLGSTHNLID